MLSDHNTYIRNKEIKPGENLPPGFFRIALGIEYSGKNYHGWQKQPDATTATVQEKLEHALTLTADESIKVVCAGRTDAGVHGIGQVVHFDTTAVRPLRAWSQGANTRLPPDIRVQWSKEVSAGFHARFSALSRTYRYLIFNRNMPTAIYHGQVTSVRQRLNLLHMQQAAALLCGKHDFSAFRGAGCQAHTPVREITAISLESTGPMIIMDITANAFLQHMVRNIMGVLIAIGRGERDVAWAAEVLASRDRKQAGVTAPSDGLYLQHVEYPTHFALPQSDLIPFAMPGLM